MMDKRIEVLGLFLIVGLGWYMVGVVGAQHFESPTENRISRGNISWLQMLTNNITIGGDLLIWHSLAPVGSFNLNGTAIFQNTQSANSTIDLLFASSGSLPQFALPIEQGGLAAYNPHSLMVGGDLSQAFNESIINCADQGYIHIDCNASSTGEDLGVEDDAEIRGILYVNESANISGNIINSSGFFNSTGDQLGATGAAGAAGAAGANGTAGALSNLTIDVSKDWSGKNLSNVGEINASTLVRIIGLQTNVSLGSNISTLFFFASDDDGPKDAGKIVMEASTFWGASASSHDADMVFYAINNGGIVEGPRVEKRGHFLPRANNTLDIGSSTLKWKTGFFVTTDVGDVMFGNDFKIVESMASDEVDGKARLYFVNQFNETIMSLTEDGDMHLAGDLHTFHNFAPGIYDRFNLRYNKTRQAQMGLYVNTSELK